MGANHPSVSSTQRTAIRHSQNQEGRRTGSLKSLRRQKRQFALPQRLDRPSRKKRLVKGGSRSRKHINVNKSRDPDWEFLIRTFLAFRSIPTARQSRPSVSSPFKMSIITHAGNVICTGYMVVTGLCLFFRLIRSLPHVKVRVDKPPTGILTTSIC
jgi:hypothetical protein